MGVALLHHDGRAECSGRSISPPIGRADVVVFPGGCASRTPSRLVKRACRNLGKPLRALGSSGLAPFLLALEGLRDRQPEPSAEAART